MSESKPDDGYRATLEAHHTHEATIRMVRLVLARFFRLLGEAPFVRYEAEGASGFCRGIARDLEMEEASIMEVLLAAIDMVDTPSKHPLDLAWSAMLGCFSEVLKRGESPTAFAVAVTGHEKAAVQVVARNHELAESLRGRMIAAVGQVGGNQ